MATGAELGQALRQLGGDITRSFDRRLLRQTQALQLRRQDIDRKKKAEARKKLGKDFPLIGTALDVGADFGQALKFRELSQQRNEPDYGAIFNIAETADIALSKQMSSAGNGALKALQDESPLVSEKMGGFNAIANAVEEGGARFKDLDSDVRNSFNTDLATRRGGEAALIDIKNDPKKLNKLNDQVKFKLISEMGLSQEAFDLVGGGEFGTTISLKRVPNQAAIQQFITAGFSRNELTREDVSRLMNKKSISSLVDIANDKTEKEPIRKLAVGLAKQYVGFDELNPKIRNPEAVTKKADRIPKGQAEGLLIRLGDTLQELEGLRRFLTDPANKDTLELALSGPQGVKFAKSIPEIDRQIKKTREAMKRVEKAARRGEAIPTKKFRNFELELKSAGPLLLQARKFIPGLTIKQVIPSGRIKETGIQTGEDETPQQFISDVLKGF